MAYEYNPLSGQFDIVGGAAVISAAVATPADLPITLGTPAVGVTYLAQSASGTWFVNYRPAGLYRRTANLGAVADWQYLGAFPEANRDDRFRIYNSADTTKQVAFDVSGISTGTTRTLTVPNASGTIATEEKVKSLDAGGLWDSYNAQQSLVCDDSSLILYNPGRTAAANISAPTLTTSRIYTLPNADGTIMLGSLNLANLTSPATALVNLGLLAAFRNASVLAPSSDTTVTSTVTPANVAGMSFSVTANTSYAMLFLGNITHGGNGFDVRVDFPSLFNMGSGVTGWGIGVLASGASGAIAGVSSTNVRLGTRGGTASTQQMFAMAVLTVAATGGTANFQFCQNSSGATNSTLLASSKALILPL